MTETVFHKPGPEHDPNKVRRSKDGRPYVWVDCQECDNGKVPSAKTGRPVQCPKCKGAGRKETLFSRCTSFVGVLEERSQLERWKQRTILIGFNREPDLLFDIGSVDPDDRDALHALIDKAFEVGDGHVRAQKGTDLHSLSVYVDNGWRLPEMLWNEDGDDRPVTLQDRADMAAWKRTVTDMNLTMLAQELFVVNDEYRIGGTYDRRVTWPATPCPCGKPTILDLKTGRIDYGQGKIAQQLAVYAHSRDYDPATGTRTAQDVCEHVGLVIHLPQGTGKATVHTADLVLGWEAVALSAAVRVHRREQADMLTQVEGGDSLFFSTVTPETQQAAVPAPQPAVSESF